jgi:hypothetical protein
MTLTHFICSGFFFPNALENADFREQIKVTVVPAGLLVLWSVCKIASAFIRTLTFHFLPTT